MSTSTFNSGGVPIIDSFNQKIPDRKSDTDQKYQAKIIGKSSLKNLNTNSIEEIFISKRRSKYSDGLEYKASLKDGTIVSVMKISKMPNTSNKIVWIESIYSDFRDEYSGAGKALLQVGIERALLKKADGLELNASFLSHGFYYLSHMRPNYADQEEIQDRIELILDQIKIRNEITEKLKKKNPNQRITISQVEEKMRRKGCLNIGSILMKMSEKGFEEWKKTIFNRPIHQKLQFES